MSINFEIITIETPVIIIKKILDGFSWATDNISGEVYCLWEETEEYLNDYTEPIGVMDINNMVWIERPIWLNHFA